MRRTSDCKDQPNAARCTHCSGYWRLRTGAAHGFTSMRSASLHHDIQKCGSHLRALCEPGMSLVCMGPSSWNPTIQRTAQCLHTLEHAGQDAKSLFYTSTLVFTSQLSVDRPAQLKWTLAALCWLRTRISVVLAFVSPSTHKPSLISRPHRPTRGRHLPLATRRIAHVERRWWPFGSADLRC
jgi:hypothetical protein